MKENNPNQRADITFARVLQVAERNGFSAGKTAESFDSDEGTIRQRLIAKGFPCWDTFAKAYSPGWKNPSHVNDGDKNPRYDRSLTFQMVCDAHEPGITQRKLAAKLGTTIFKIAGRVIPQGFKSPTDFCRNYQNCKVVSVEPVGVIDLYDLTVDKYKNFATDFLVSHNTPELSAALRIYADEVTAKDEDGNIIRISSKSETIKEVLETLFHDIIDIDFNAWGWARNLCMYGDLALFVDASAENGILNLLPIPINELEREEGYDKKDPFSVRFRWMTQNNMVLQNWQVVHFRLLENDTFLPYGTSMLEAARRIWRQLIIIEDAMMVYRIVRSPERRVFKIDVGNIAPNEVDQYMEHVKTEMKRNAIVDNTTGRVDLRYNPLCMDPYTLIPLTNGKTIELKELADRWESGERDWEVYSLDLQRGGVHVPGKVIWAGKSGHVSRMVEVTFDDGGKLRVTSDHKLMLRDGNPCSAVDLKPGDSVMPCYTRFIGVSDGAEDRMLYEQIFVPKFNSYFFTHRLFAAEKYGLDVYPNGFIGQQGSVIHHVNFDKRDNSRGNLLSMSREAHSSLHAEIGKKNLTKYNRSAEKKQRTSELNRLYRTGEHMGSVYNGTELHKKHNVIRSKALKAMWDDPARRARTKENMRFKFDETCKELLFDVVRALESVPTQDEFCELLKNDVRFMEHYSQLNSHLRRPAVKSIYRHWLTQRTREFGFGSFKSMFVALNPRAAGFVFDNNVVVQSTGVVNHKVVSVEVIEVETDVYNLTVEGHFNLAIQCPNKKGTLEGKVQSFQSVDEDYFLPYRGDRGPTIETLPGGQFTGDIDDVQYIQGKLFSALQIPKAYLGNEGDVGSKSLLSQEDVRFAKTIERIQKIFVAELNKIAVIHLFLLGFKGEQLTDFDITMASPSTIAEQQRLELWRLKLEVASMAQEGMFDRRTIQKDIFKMTDEKVSRILEGKKLDKLEDLELENMQAPGAAGDASGAPIPGEEELPDTLGGTPSEPPAASPDGSSSPPQNASVEPVGSVIADAVKNPGSEGDDAAVAVDRGKDLFSTGDDQHELVFGTEKQTASDPYDERARRRLVTRPFSEALDELDGEFGEMADTVERGQSELEEELRGLAKITDL